MSSHAFWHLLMNLNNKYWKKLFKWANKKLNNFIFIMLISFKRIRKTPGDIIMLQLCTKNFDDMICSS